MTDVEKREKENFLRNAVLVVDHSKAALMSLIEADLKLKGVRFDQFLNNNQHDIFHLCFPRIRCCQCVRRRNTSHSRVMYPPQMELLYDKTTKLHSNHVNAVGANDFCCSAAKPSVTIDILDMTLTRCFLVNLCFDVFWNFNLQYKKQSLGDFLNAEKHSIYHLWQNSTRCCQCPAVFTSTLNFPKLDPTEWQAMFHVVSPLQPCSVSTGASPCLCMYQASPAITLPILSPQLQQKILEHCCPLRQKVDTLVKIRNERFGHVKNARLSDSEFQAIKVDLEQAMIDIAVFCNTEPAVRKAIHSTLTESLDYILSEKHKELIGQFCQELAQQSQEIKKIKKSLQREMKSSKLMKKEIMNKKAKLESKIEQFEKDQSKILQDPVPSNIRDNIKQELKEWEDNDNTFIQTTASKAIYKLLETNNCVTITASSGVGKTVTLRHVALLMKKEEYDVLPITDPRDVEQFYRQNHKTLFVIDDFCGRYSLNHTYIEKWKNYIDKVGKIVENDVSTKFLIACRLQVCQDELFKPLCMFLRCECNLLSDEFCLSFKEKVALAKFYVKEEAYKVLFYLDCHYCYPLLCKMYSLSPTLKINDFFQNPYTVYESEFDKLYSEGHNGKYCVLALCVMFNNHLKEDWFTEDIDDIHENIRNVIEKTCEACKLNRGTSRLQLLNELSSLKHMFVKKEQDVFKAIHDRIFDFLSFYFGKKMLKTLVKNANSRLISERFLLEGTDINRNIEFITIIPSLYRDIYLNRMISDWSKGKVVDVFCNTNMKSQNFREVFLSFLLQRDPSEQKQLATMQDSRNGSSAILQCCFKGEINIMKWCIENNGDVNSCRSDTISPYIWPVRKVI